MRGIRLILIPTTLLAMVDAAIGGKTSINTPFGKNLLGSYYPPDAILCDLRFLKTLPSMEWQNGLAEILKIGLISDDSLCIEPQTKDTILKAILQKIKIVMEDPYDQGFRKTLNFGHTIGHALETLSKYKIPHGKAVALGCLAEAHLSMNLGFLNPKDFEKIKKMYLSFSLKIPRNCSSKKLIETMRIDKKNQNGNVHCVLIDQIGHAIEFEGKYTRAISEEELIPTLSWIKSY